MSFKKLLSLVLVLCMVLSFFPISAFAEAEEPYVEEVVEEVPAEEPAEAEAPAEPEAAAEPETPAQEEPAAEEPVAEEVVEEEIVFEEVVEEAETTTDEAMDATIVATIDVTYEFETLTKAIAAAGGATVHNAKDILLVADTPLENVSIAKELSITGQNNTERISGNVDITSGTVTLQDVTVIGNVTVSGGEVTLKNVSVNGDVTVSGGSLTIEGTGTYAGTVTVTAGTISIKGGVFNERINKEYLADGYVTPDFNTATDGMCVGEVSETNDAYLVGAGSDRKYFNSSASAIEAAGNEKFIVLMRSVPSIYKFGKNQETVLRIKKDDKEFNVVYGDNVPYAGVTDPSTGVTTWVTPVAATYSEDTATGYYGTFAAAAEAAVAAGSVVQFVPNAVLAADDTYTLKATTETLKVVPGAITDLATRILSVDETKYSVKVTPVVDPATYNAYTLENNVASIQGQTKTFYYGASKWSEAVENAINSKNVVLNMLADAPSSGTIGLSASENFIIIRDNGYTVKVEPDDNLNKTKSEDGTTTTYRYVANPVATVTWYEPEGEFGKLKELKNVFTTFKDAAAFAVAADAADPDADAVVTVNGQLADTDKYKLTSGSLTVVDAGETGFDPETTVYGEPEDSVTHTTEGTTYVYTVKNEFTVEFEITGGTVPGGAIPAQTVELGKTVKKPAVDPVSNVSTKAFAGWYVASDTNPDGVVYTLYDFETPVTGNLTLTALYTAARIDLADGSTEFYKTFQAAAKSINEAYATRQNLIITPLVDSEWAFDIEWKNKSFKVANTDFTLEAKPVGNYTLASAEEETFTVYTVVPAVAKIGNGDDVKYFATLSEAFVAAGGTKIVTLLQTMDAEGQAVKYEYAFNSTDKVTVLKVNKAFEDIEFTVTSNVEGKGVKEVPVTTDPAHTVYSLTTAVASVTVDDVTTYYSKFADAAAVATYDAEETEEMNTVVLLAKPAKDDVVTLEANKQVTVDESKYTATVKAEAGHAVVKTTDDNNISNYKSVEAYASVAYLDEEGEDQVEYFAKFADAAAFAFVSADEEIESAPVVNLLKKPTAQDVFSVSEEGSVVVNVGVTAVTLENLVKKNFALDDGLAFAIDAQKVTISSAVASITAKGKTTYYATFEKAAKAATYPADETEEMNTVVLLAKPAKDDVVTLQDNKQVTVDESKYTATVETVENYAVVKTTDDNNISNYKSVQAVAKVTVAGKEDQYFVKFAEAAEVAFVPTDAEVDAVPTITLLKTPTAKDVFSVSEEGSVVVDVGETEVTLENLVKKNFALDDGLASAIDAQKVTISSAVASITDKGTTTYYPKFEDAATVAKALATKTKDLKTVVLLADVVSETGADLPYTLENGMQINVKKGEFSLKVVAPENSVIIEKTDDNDVTNYTCVTAVASVPGLNDEGEEVSIYYATFAEAADVAFVPADKPVEEALTVTMLSAPKSKDVFTAGEGTMRISVAKLTDDQIASFFEKNFVAKAGLAVSNETVKDGDTYKYNLLTVAPAAASVTLTDGTVEYYPTFSAAVVEDLYTRNNPIVLLAEGQSYQMPQDATKPLFVEKNGFDDFTVTKTNPTSAEPLYAIEEVTEGKLTTYSVSKDPVVAHITFKEEKPGETGGFIIVDNVVAYTDFAVAADAAENGEHVIVLDASVKDPYTMTNAGDVLKVQKGDFALNVRPASGLAVSYEDSTAPVVTTYTAVAAIASVEAEFTAGTKSVRVYGDGELGKAVADALKYKNSLITLSVDPAETDVFTLAKGQFLTVAAGDHGFTEANFEVPDGCFVKVEQLPEGAVKPTTIIFTAAEALVSVGEGEDAQFFDNFTDAVEYAVDHEDSIPGTATPSDPRSVITLWVDMAKFEDVPGNGFVLPYKYDEVSVNSLLIKAQGHETYFTKEKSEAGTFVDVEENVTEGVDRYVAKHVAASVTTNDEYSETTYYSSFAAAATDAFNMDSIVTVYGGVSGKDVYQMPIGTLKVWSDNEQAADYVKGLANKNILPYGESVTIAVDDSASTATQKPFVLFTVEGYEAAIKYPNQTALKYFSTFEKALADAVNKGVVIVPLTSVTKDITNVVGIAPNATFNVADNGYDVVLQATNLELVTEGTDPVKYTAKTAVAAVDTGEVFGYTTDGQYQEIERVMYFSEFKDAVAYAGNTQIIDVLAETTYKMAAEDEFWVPTEDINGENAFLTLSAPDGYAVAKEEGTEKYEGNTKCTCGNFTVTLSGGSVPEKGSGKTLNEEGTYVDTYVVDSFGVGEWINLEPFNGVFTLMNDQNKPVLGYVITGWKYTGDGSEPLEMPKASISYEAQWTAVDPVNIKWLDGNGKTLKTTTQYPGEELAVVGLDQLNPVPTRDGYRPDYSNLWSPSTDEITTVPVTQEDMIFNMNWVEQHTVTLRADGKTVDTVDVDHGDVLANYELPTLVKDGYDLGGWTLNGTDFDLANTKVMEDLTLDAKWVPADYSKYARVSRNLTLGEEIVLNVNVTIKEGTSAADYTVNAEFVNAEGVKTSYVGVLSNVAKQSGERVYRMSFAMAAKEMNIPVNVSVKYKGNPASEDKAYSVRDFCELYASSTSDEKAINICKAILDYGAYAQLNFGYDTANLANRNLSSGKVPTTVVPEAKKTESGACTGISKTGGSMSLESAFGMNVTFVPTETASAENLENYKFTIDGSPAVATVQGGRYALKLEGLVAKELGNTHEFKITNKTDGTTLTVVDWPNAYLYRAYNGGNTNLKNLCSAIYLYNQAAIAYFTA